MVRPGHSTAVHLEDTNIRMVSQVANDRAAQAVQPRPVRACGHPERREEGHTFPFPAATPQHHHGPRLAEAEGTQASL